MTAFGKCLVTQKVRWCEWLLTVTLLTAPQNLSEQWLSKVRYKKDHAGGIEARLKRSGRWLLQRDISSPRYYGLVEYMSDEENWTAEIEHQRVAGSGKTN